MNKKIKKILTSISTPLFFMIVIIMDYPLPLLNWFDNNSQYKIHAEKHLYQAQETIQKLSHSLNGHSWKLGSIKYSRIHSWKYVNNIIYINGCTSYNNIQSFFVKNHFHYNRERDGYCKDNIVFYYFISHNHSDGLCNELYFYIEWDKNKSCI